MNLTELEVALEDFKMLNQSISKESIKEIYEVLKSRLIEIETNADYMKVSENEDNHIRVKIYLGTDSVGSILIMHESFHERINIYVMVERVDKHSESFNVRLSEHYVASVVPNGPDHEIMKTGSLANEKFIDELVTKTLEFIYKKVSK